MWGFTLEDHPLRIPKLLLIGAVGGSAGIPDSLGHKPVDTSGRAAWLPSFLFSPPSQLISLICLSGFLPSIFIVALLWALPFTSAAADA